MINAGDVVTAFALGILTGGFFMALMLLPSDDIEISNRAYGTCLYTYEGDRHIDDVHTFCKERTGYKPKGVM